MKQFSLKLYSKANKFVSQGGFTMPLFDEKVKTQLAQLLSKLTNPITLHFFSQEIECPTCQTTHQFVEEFPSLSDKISLHTYDRVKDSDIVKAFNIDKIPAIVVSDSKNTLK